MILPFLVQIFRTFATVTFFVQCLLVNTLQYPDAVDVVQDSETEDPHGASNEETVCGLAVISH